MYSFCFFNLHHFLLRNSGNNLKGFDFFVNGSPLNLVIFPNCMPEEESTRNAEMPMKGKYIVSQARSQQC